MEVSSTWYQEQYVGDGTWVADGTPKMITIPSRKLESYNNLLAILRTLMMIHTLVDEACIWWEVCFWDRCRKIMVLRLRQILQTTETKLLTLVHITNGHLQGKGMGKTLLFVSQSGPMMKITCRLIKPFVTWWVLTYLPIMILQKNLPMTITTDLM